MAARAAAAAAPAASSSDAPFSQPSSPTAPSPTAMDQTVERRATCGRPASADAAAAATATSSSSCGKAKRPIFRWVPTDDEKLAEAERAMLHTVQYEQRYVEGLNTVLSVPPAAGAAAAAGASAAAASPSPSSSEATTPRETIVLLHGFAGGLAMWVQNWQALAGLCDVIAIDLPGFARSERPTLHFNTAAEAMDFYMERLDRWFAAMDFQRPVTLVGHSFGAYISARYALRHGAARVKHIVLCDPWGVPTATEKQLNAKHPMFVRFYLALFYMTNPLSVLRGAGPIGPKLVQRFRPDFADRWRNFTDPKHFFDYTYHINAQYPPTGEHAFKACCQGACYAREPLDTMLPEKLDPKVRASVLYGETTWMHKDHTKKLAATLQERGYATRLWCISNAGHQLNTDNADEFNAVMAQALSLPPVE